MWKNKYSNMIVISGYKNTNYVSDLTSTKYIIIP